MRRSKKVLNMSDRKNDYLVITLAISTITGCVLVGFTTFAFNVLYLRFDQGIKNPIWALKKDYVIGFFNTSLGLTLGVLTLIAWLSVLCCFAIIKFKVSNANK